MAPLVRRLLKYFPVNVVRINKQSIRHFARQAFKAGHGFSVQVDPKSGLFISFNICASPSHSHTSREQGQDQCPVPAPQPAWSSTPRGKDVLISFDAPSPNANVSRTHGVPRKPRASTPVATPARVSQETPQRSPSAPSPFKQKMKWMRSVFPINQYEMITKDIIKDCLDACDGDEKQACMKLIALMINDKFLEEGGGRRMCPCRKGVCRVHYRRPISDGYTRVTFTLLSTTSSRMR